MRTNSRNFTRVFLPLVSFLAVGLAFGMSNQTSTDGPNGDLGGKIKTRPRIIAAQFNGAIYTTDENALRVDQNLYAMKTDVYLSGGPQNQTSRGLPDGTYYFQVTDPSGNTLLSSDNAVCRQLQVIGGRVAGSTGSCPHSNGTFNPANGVTPVQLSPYDSTPNAGGEYKAWLIRQTPSTSISSSDPKVIIFKHSDSKTDNFKVEEGVTPPPGSCQPSSSLSVLVTGTNAIAYIPKGCWTCGTTGISFVNVEGTFATGSPNPIPTPDVVNSCACNSLTNKIVCTANGTDVYVLTLSGTGTTSIGPTLTSGGSGTIGFSGGFCTNCGVAMDATHDQAVIGISVGGTPGFQFIKTISGTPTFEPAFTTMASQISEDALIDPIRNLVLSAAEDNNYEIVNVATTTSPAFFEQSVSAPGELDSSGEDCTTGIVLAPAEFAQPSAVFIADISNPTFAPFTPGSPGTWTAPQQTQSLSESNLAAGSSGIAVAQGTFTGIVSGEFGGSAITAIVLPTTSGTGAVPAISDWVTCSIPGFSNGLDPHTVTAYKSPNTSKAVALLANAGASALAVVNLTDMLNPTIVPRTGGGHGCAAGTLPASVVTLLPIP